MKYVSNVGPNIPTQRVTNQSLTDYYNVITSEVYDKDFKNFTIPLEPEVLQIMRTLGKYINKNVNHYHHEF